MILYTKLRKLYNSLGDKKRKKYIASLVSNGLKLGENVNIVGDFFFDPSHCFLISIGSNTTLAPNVRLIAHDASTKLLLGCTKIGGIEIGMNCFIGDSTIVLPGVKIGDNSIVGAGSVVTKSIPENCVVAGNPAKVVTTIDIFRTKWERARATKKVFGDDYYIGKLNKKKRQEILDSVKDEIGFIV